MQRAVEMTNAEDPHVRSKLGKAQYQAEAYEEAASTFEQAYVLFEQSAPVGEWRVAGRKGTLDLTTPVDTKVIKLMGRWGSALTELRRFEEAEVLLLDAYALLEGLPRSDAARDRITLERISRLYDLWGRSIWPLGPEPHKTVKDRPFIRQYSLALEHETVFT